MEYDNPVRRSASGGLGKEDGAKLSGGSLFTSYYGGIRSGSEVNEIYFMGIIDILQVLVLLSLDLNELHLLPSL